MHNVEVKGYSEMKLFCPFCGTKVLSENGLSQCEHILFQATDEGFEYVSEKLDFKEDIDLEDKSMDEFTDEIEYPNSVKFAFFMPAPSFFGAYIALAA